MSDSSGTTTDTVPPSPLHAGETALQKRAGVHARMDAVARVVIRDHMPDQHRTFFAQLPDLFLAGLDAADQPWATVLAGPPGFLCSPDPRALEVASLPGISDPLATALRAGAPVGLLGLEPHTRRRNRMNGIVTQVTARGFTVAVRQSFGNCPKYIQARQVTWHERPPGAVDAVAVDGTAILDRPLREVVLRADTFFVASRSPVPGADNRADGLDVSHRGGLPGFVRIDDIGDHSVLTIPDFVGNSLFNTLGNVLVHPACALAFIDYTDGSLLHLAGDGEIVWDGPEVARYAGAERLWRFHVRTSRWRPRALPLSWSTAGFAPQLTGLGGWLPAESPAHPLGELANSPPDAP